MPDALEPISKSQLQSAASVLAATKEVLSKCEAEKYYIIAQPELTVSALSKSASHIRKIIEHESTKASLAVSEVVGLKVGDRQELVRFIQEKCGAKISNRFVENARYGARDFVTQQWEPMIGGWTESEQKMGRSGELSLTVRSKKAAGSLLKALCNRPWTTSKCSKGPRQTPSLHFHSPFYTFLRCRRGGPGI